MKTIIISQAQFDHAKQRKFILTSLLGIIFNLAIEFVTAENSQMEKTLPKTNSGYVTAGSLKFIDEAPDWFFINTSAQDCVKVQQHIKRQELDSETRKTEVESLLGEGYDETTATSMETKFVGLVST